MSQVRIYITRIIIFLFLFILASCTAIPDIRNQDSIPPIGNTFELSEKCPHLCWLGINPGVTKAEDATTIVSSSSQVDQQWTKATDTDMLARWFVGGSRSSTCTVDIKLEKGVVQSISLGPLPYTVDDIVVLLGQPDQIAITQLTTPDQPYFTYDLYYVKQRITVDIHTTGTNGPQPSDKGYDFWLNVEFYAATHPLEWGKPQPWLGYGHLNDYLPGVVIPPTYVMPTP